jgi:hypothetical protein
VNYNPRTITRTLVIGTATAFAFATTACGSHHDHPVQTPGYQQQADRPDCDLDDLSEGDADCNDPVAYSAAVRKYGSKKVAAAQRKYAEKRAKESAKKHLPTLPKRANTTPPQRSNPTLPKVGGTKNATLPKRTSSTRR